MSLNIIEKPLPTIAEEECQTQETQGDEMFVTSCPPKLNFPAPNDTFVISERMIESLNSLDKKSNDDTTFIVSHTNHMNKPIVRFETTLAVNLYQIKDIFERVCKKKGFEIVDDEGDQVTAVNKKMTQWKDLIFSCIPGSSKSAQNLTAIRLQSKTNKVTCIRRITLKALIGDLKLANALFTEFGRELESSNVKRAVSSPPLNGSTILSDNIIGLALNNQPLMRFSSMRDDLNQDVDETLISTQNLESSSFYEFRKILSAEQYSIGKKVAGFLTDFMANYKCPLESAQLLPQPMESVYFLVNEITETFFADFNYGKKETKQMMPFCRISVEKYIFDKVYTQLFGMYMAKYEQEKSRFEEKTKLITQQTTFIEQFKFLDIPVKFWLIPSDKLDETNNLNQSIQAEEMPYIDAINELNKVSCLKSPREKLGALLMMHSLMKAAVVDFHKGREEVYSMDEELPILIYILLHSKLENMVAEFNFVDDYVQFDPQLESEKRLMTNLRVSLQYIADEWKTEFNKGDV